MLVFEIRFRDQFIQRTSDRYKSNDVCRNKICPLFLRLVPGIDKLPYQQFYYIKRYWRKQHVFHGPNICCHILCHLHPYPCEFYIFTAKTHYTIIKLNRANLHLNTALNHLRQYRGKLVLTVPASWSFILGTCSTSVPSLTLNSYYFY